jgi:ABC-type amino acid transport substrate-binding protein
VKNQRKSLTPGFAVTLLLFLSVLNTFSTSNGADEKSALERVKTRGSIIFCADRYNYPFSTDNVGNPGFDIEIAALIAKQLNLTPQFFWVDTGTRGGLGRALRNSILEKRCDVFLSLPTGKEGEEEMEEKGLLLTKPYFGTGFVLIARGDTNGITGLNSVKGKKIGVEMTTPADWYLYKNGYDRSLFRYIPEILDAMKKGELDVALVWAPMAGSALKDHPESKAKLIEGYVPEPALRWSLAMAVRKEDKDLVDALNPVLEGLSKGGQVKEILSKYGVPFYPPFPEE